MGLPVEKLVKLPQELRDQLPKEYQDVIAEYEAPSEFDDVVPDTGDMEVEETL
jgi:cation transport regulator ChaB